MTVDLPDRPYEPEKDLPDISELPIEQQFSVAQFEVQADLMKREDAIKFLKIINRQRLLERYINLKLVRDNGL